MPTSHEPYVARMGRGPALIHADFHQLVRYGVVNLAKRGKDIEGVIVLWAETDHVYIGNSATPESSRSYLNFRSTRQSDSPR